MRSAKILLPAAAVLLAAMLFLFNPEETVWLPKCPVHLLTGLQCPSCGIQRAIYSLLHGQFHAAFHYNPILPFVLPYGVAIIVVTCCAPHGRLHRLKSACLRPTTVYSFLAVMVGWGVLRNILGI